MDIETRKSSRKMMLFGCGGCAVATLVGFVVLIVGLVVYSNRWANTPEGKAKIVANKRAEAQTQADEQKAEARQAALDKARERKEQIAAKLARQRPDPDDPFGLEPGFQTKYNIVAEEDVSNGATPRRTIRIALPAGLSRKAVEQNMRYAAKYEYDQSQPHAVIVFAYRQGTNYQEAYTAGKCEFAPYGDWGRASEDVSLDQYKASIDLNDAYFAKR